MWKMWRKEKRVGWSGTTGRNGDRSEMRWRRERKKE